MPKPPLIYGPDGNSTLIADDSEDKLRALCIIAFGALKSVRRGQSGSEFITPDQLESFQNFVASKIISVVGQEAVEQYFGIKLASGPKPPTGVM